MAGEVTFFEVMGQDPAKLRGFFSELFGWRFEAVPGMDYGLVDAQDKGIKGGVGGFPGTGSGWTTFYVKVESVDAASERAVALGGRVLLPKVTLPDGMDIGVIADPEGHAIGLVA